MQRFRSRQPGKKINPFMALIFSCLLVTSLATGLSSVMGIFSPTEAYSLILLGILYLIVFVVTCIGIPRLLGVSPDIRSLS